MILFSFDIGTVVLDSNVTPVYKYYINRVSFSQDYVTGHSFVAS